MAARVRSPATLTNADEAVQISGARVSPHYFEIFGLKAALGRTFADGDDQPGNDHVVVLSHALWRSQFGGDPGIVGRRIQLDGEPHTVIGVLPAESAFERGEARLWRPLTFSSANATRNFYWFGTVARLKRGTTVAQARAEMSAIGARLAQAYPDTNRGWGIAVDPLGETVVGADVRRSVYLLFAAVAMVLLIACANLANLSLMRVVGREREISIRLALGASRWAIVRQFLSESLVLALVGGAGGLLVGFEGIHLITAALPPFSIPPDLDIRLDRTVLVFAFGVSVATALAIGLLPALQAARQDLGHALKQGGAGTGGRTHSIVRRGLVVLEIALAFVLLTGAGLLIRSLGNLGKVDPGFDSADVLTFELPIAERDYPDAAALNAYVRSVRDRLRAVPGVTNVAMTSALPMEGWGYGMGFQIANQPVVDRANRPVGFFKMVSPSYFRTLSMRLLRGRSLAATDTQGSPPVAVISASLAQRYFGGADPIGQRILVQQIVPGKTQLGDDIAWQVVGIVADEKVVSLDDTENNRGLYVTTEQSPSYQLAVVVHCAANPAVVREPLRRAIHDLNANQPMPNLKPLDAIKDASLVASRVRSRLLSLFAALSLLLAAIGIYGVIAYSVAQRTREIGVRTALGATRSQIVRLVLGSALRLSLVGLAVGFLGTLVLTRVLASMLFGVGTQDPLTLVTATAVLGGVAVLACLLPARRATNVDPIVALRDE